MIDSALLIAGVVAIAGIADRLWLAWGRPYMTRRYGWRPASADERISAAYIFGAAIVAILFFAIAHIGAAAGF